MLLLDTCAVLWLVDDQSALSSEAAKAIRDNAGYIFISAITGFELTVKHKKGRLKLPQPPEKWYPKALELHGLREIPINGTIAVHAANLPDIHNDPCDRIIIATAQRHELDVITIDKTIPQYPRTRVIW